MENTNTPLYRAVKAYAAETGTTLNAISKAVGCDYQVFNKRLNGTRKFSFGEAYRLSEILGISMEKLYQMAPEVNKC